MCVKSEELCENIRVNGIQMYKVEDRLFLIKREAMSYARALCNDDYCQQDKVIERRRPANYKALAYGTMDDSYSIEKALEKGTLKGILL